jgi:hypothetical protein
MQMKTVGAAPRLDAHAAANAMSSTIVSAVNTLSLRTHGRGDGARRAASGRRTLDRGK